MGNGLERGRAAYKERGNDVRRLTVSDGRFEAETKGLSE